MIQFFEDDIYGYVRFVDVRADNHGLKALPSHIRIVSDMSKEAKKPIRRAIADDINCNIEEATP